MSEKVFISHSQNREDVILWRALGHVENGFYIDVGANHPCDDSVTKAFYDRGWCGINIEPLPSHLEELKNQRTRDINLGIAVGAEQGELEIFNTPIRGLATASASVAQGHQSRGLKIESLRVPVQRLEDIWRANVTGPVHFLKIDVEGFEEEVLKGMDLTQQRPWILVIEATRPNSKEIDAHWEHLVLSKGYQYVYFDGLNRYYLADEHLELDLAFSAPPNIFDSFITAEQQRLSDLVKSNEYLLQEKIKEFESSKKSYESNITSQNLKISELINNSNKLENNIININNHLNEVYSSTSWRITAPLRKAASFAKKIIKAIKKYKNIDSKEKQNTECLPKNNQLTNLLPRKKFRWHAKALPKNVVVASVPASANTDPNNYWWRITGHLEGHYSLAAVNRGLAIALDKISHGQLHFQAWHGEKYTPGNDIPEHQRATLQQALQRSIPSDAKTISLVHHYPLITDEQSADLRLGVFFWEEARVPQDMVDKLNQNLDAVLVSSRFVRAALRYSGFQHPIFIVPLGLSQTIHDSPVPTGLQIPQGTQPFRFLHISSAFERKGIDCLLAAYFEHFTAQDAVELLIKSFPNPHHDLERTVQEWRQRFPQGPLVHVELADLNESQIIGLYQGAHAFVFPSRGEGFGLPAAEALAMGLPLITTGFGGQADFATQTTAALVPYQFAASRSHVHSDGSYWAEPSHIDLGLQMQKVRQQVLANDAALHERCQNTAQWIRKTYDWENCAQEVQAIASQLLEHKNQARSITNQDKKLNLTLISPWHTQCGVAEYAQSILANSENYFRLQVFCDSRTAADHTQSVYTPSWSIQNEASLLNLLKEIEQSASRPDVLMVQHQPSLFALSEAICEKLAAIEKQGVTVVVELHSTLPLVREARLSPKSANCLEQLSLVVVHSIGDVSNMLAIGNTNNVMCLPLGIGVQKVNPQPDITRASLGIADDDLVLGCFGFLWGHKGVDNVIKSMVNIARKTNRKVRLLAVTATPDANSHKVYEQYQALATSLGIAEDIIWYTDFLPIEKSLKLLSLADFQIFSYSHTTESTSAAVTIGLATEKPVLVSPESIFSDLSECTFKLASHEASAIENGILELIASEAKVAELVQAQKNWLQERSWTKVSSRLMNAICGIHLQKSYAEINQTIAIHKNNKKQLLVDVSELFFRDAGTGIQRVVRSILENWMKNPPDGYTVRAVYAAPGQAYRYTEKFSSFPNAEIDNENVKANFDDIFIGLDLSAHLFPEIEDQLHAWRLKGVRICYVIYDIIPLLYPKLVVPSIIPAFEKWMGGLSNEADRLVCISASVMHDVRNWLAHKNPKNGIPEINYFNLGANFIKDISAASTSSVQNTDPIIQAIQGKTSFLMVGTVEPRKGYGQALDALEVLWSQGMDAHLVIVGKRGWLVEALVQRLEQHPQMNQKIHWIENADDQQLLGYYRTCSALLAASEAEGFGLPLIESAQNNLPIIARDIPVFREIAKEHAFYFQAMDGASLANALKEWISLHNYNKNPPSHSLPWITWEESATQLWEAIK